MLPSPPLDLSGDRPILLLDIDGVINVFQCATARETQIAPYLPAIKLLPGLAVDTVLADHAAGGRLAAEQLLVDSKRDRDADAAAMNMQIVTWRDRRAANEAFVAGTGDALRTWRQP